MMPWLDACERVVRRGLTLSIADDGDNNPSGTLTSAKFPPKGFHPATESLRTNFHRTLEQTNSVVDKSARWAVFDSQQNLYRVAALDLKDLDGEGCSSGRTEQEEDGSDSLSDSSEYPIVYLSAADAAASAASQYGTPHHLQRSAPLS